jgi:hypothetical protein
MPWVSKRRECQNTIDRTVMRQADFFSVATAVHPQGSDKETGPEPG